MQDIFNDQTAWDAYHEVIDETGIAAHARIRLLPMYSKDLAFAAERVNDAYCDAPSGFALTHGRSDEQIALSAGDDPLDSPCSVRDIWNRVEDPGRFGATLAPATLGSSLARGPQSGPSLN